jgi:hypothetical protein
VRCWIEQIHFNANWYNASGKCEEFNKRTDSQGNYGVNVPFSAVGRYDPATHGTFESIRIVKGGLDIPSHYYYGTLETNLSCPVDPWLEKTTACQLDRVTTTDTIPSYYVDGLVRRRGRPFTSDMSDAQRAGLIREYQAAGHKLNEMVKVPADGPMARGTLQQAISTAVAGRLAAARDERAAKRRARAGARTDQHHAGANDGRGAELAAAAPDGRGATMHSRPPCASRPGRRRWIV